MQSELKPCPFCGAAGMFENARGSYGYYPEKLRVRCSDEGCHGQTGWFNHGERDYDETPVAKSKAITAWNTRAQAAEITRLTEALRAAYEREKGLREALVKADEPHWFYAEGYEDRCLYGPDDAIDLLDFDAGEYVTEVVTARPCRSIWCAVRVTDDEDADERFTFTEHDSEESARAALKGPSHDA